MVQMKEHEMLMRLFEEAEKEIEADEGLDLDDILAETEALISQ